MSVRPWLVIVMVAVAAYMAASVAESATTQPGVVLLVCVVVAYGVLVSAERDVVARWWHDHHYPRR